MQVHGWHGGHRWQSPPEIRPPRAGRYEHGAGIYLSNIWSRAADYAKGGGSVLRLTLEVDEPDPQPVPIAEVVEFVRTCPGLRGRKEILDYLRESARERFMPEFLSNLCVNERSLTAVSAPHLAQWMTDHGQPLLTSRIGAVGGEEEEWMVVFDPTVIRRAEVVRAAELDRLPTYRDRNFPTFSDQFAEALDLAASTPRL